MPIKRDCRPASMRVEEKKRDAIWGKVVEEVENLKKRQL